MSTHYGRMVLLDDQSCCSPTPRTRRSTSTSTSAAVEGMAVYRRTAAVLHRRRPQHFWDASPENWSSQEKYAKGCIECFYGYHSSCRRRGCGRNEKFDRYTERGHDHDLFEVGYADKAIFQPTYLKDFYPGGLQHIEQNAEIADAQPRQVRRQRRLRPA